MTRACYSIDAHIHLWSLVTYWLSVGRLESHHEFSISISISVPFLVATESGRSSQIHLYVPAFHMYCITPRLLEYIQILWMQNVLLPPSQLSPCIPHDPPSCSQPSSMLLNYPEHVISSSSLAAHKPSSKPHATLKCHVYPGHRWWQILLYQHHFGRAEFLSHDRHG